MSNALRKMKREKNKTSPSSLNEWKRGFDAGAKAQNEADRKYLVQLLLELESIPGIGEKTADKVRQFFKEKFGR